MKEKISKISDTIKGLLNKIKEQLKKINAINKMVEVLKPHRLVLSIVFFVAVILTLILVATLGWGEFVVPVCVLMILEVTMAVLLHRSELWLHGILLILHIVAGILIGRVPMTMLCIVAYLTTTITQNVACKKAEVVEEVEEKKQSTPPLKKKNKSNKKN